MFRMMKFDAIALLVLFGACYLVRCAPRLTPVILPTTMFGGGINCNANNMNPCEKHPGLCSDGGGLCTVKGPCEYVCVCPPRGQLGRDCVRPSRPDPPPGQTQETNDKKVGSLLPNSLLVFPHDLFWDLNHVAKPGQVIRTTTSTTTVKPATTTTTTDATTQPPTTAQITTTEMPTTSTSSFTSAAAAAPLITKRSTARVNQNNAASDPTANPRGQTTFPTIPTTIEQITTTTTRPTTTTSTIASANTPTTTTTPATTTPAESSRKGKSSVILDALSSIGQQSKNNQPTPQPMLPVLDLAAGRSRNFNNNPKTSTALPMSGSEPDHAHSTLTGIQQTLGNSQSSLPDLSSVNPDATSTGALGIRSRVPSIIPHLSLEAIKASLQNNNDGTTPEAPTETPFTGSTSRQTETTRHSTHTSSSSTSSHVDPFRNHGNLPTFFSGPMSNSPAQPLDTAALQKIVHRVFHPALSRFPSFVPRTISKR